MNNDKCNKIIKGINKGCELEKCKLIGGETSEMKVKYLKDKLAGGKKLTIKTHKGEQTGKFGRILGEVFISGKNINLQMCKEGYAVAYYGQNKKLIQNQHKKNKKKLIANGIIKN